MPNKEKARREIPGIYPDEYLVADCLECGSALYVLYENDAGEDVCPLVQCRSTNVRRRNKDAAG